MKSKFLHFLRYVVEHPSIKNESDVERVLSMPEFSGVFWYYSNFRNSKPHHCPGCGEDLPLTKHHVIPKKNGGKGKLRNYVYVCRKCHDWLHLMFSKLLKIIAYVEKNPTVTIPELVMRFHTTKKVVVAAVLPDYYSKCKERHEKRMSKKLSAAMKIFE
jgi:hypothetical protein